MQRQIIFSKGALSRKSLIVFMLTTIFLFLQGKITYPGELTLNLNIIGLPAACTPIFAGKIVPVNCSIAVGANLAFTVQATVTATGPQGSLSLDVELSVAEGLPANVNFPSVKGPNRVSQNFNFTPMPSQVGAIFPVRFVAKAGGLAVNLIVQILVAGPGAALNAAAPVPAGGPMPPVLPLPALPAGVTGAPACLNWPSSPLLFFCNKLLLK